MIRIASKEFGGNKQAVFHVTSNTSTKPKLVKKALSELPLEELSKITGRNVVLSADNATVFSMLDRESSTSEVLLSLNPKSGAKLIDIPKNEFKKASNLKYLVLAKKPRSGNGFSEIVVLHKKNAEELEAVRVYGEDLGEKPQGSFTWEILSAFGEESVHGNNGFSLGLQAEEQRGVTNRARVEMSGGTQEKEIPTHVTASDRPAPAKIIELPTSVQRLVAMLKSGREPEDGFETLILGRLSKFDHESHREAVAEAGKNAKRKNTKAAYDVGRKHCIQYTIDGDMDESLRHWASENREYSTFALGVLNEPYKRIRKTESETQEPKLRPERTPPQIIQRPPAETAAPPQLPAKPTNRWLRTTVVGPNEDGKENGQIDTKAKTPFDVGSGMSNAREILKNLEGKDIRDAVTIQITDGYTRVGVYRLASLQTNSQRMVFYYLGQNTEVVTEKKIRSITDFVLSKPDFYLSCGLGLNKKFFELCDKEKIRKWLAQPDTANTLFGKNYKWQLNGRKGRPPVPPPVINKPPTLHTAGKEPKENGERDNARYNDILEIIKIRLKDGKTLSQTQKNNIRNIQIKPADRDEIIELIKKAPDNNEAAYILGKNNSIRKLSDGNYDLSLWKWIRQNHDHALGRGALDRRLHDEGKKAENADEKIIARADAFLLLARCEAGELKPDDVPIDSMLVRANLIEILKSSDEKDNSTVTLLAQSPSFVRHSSLADSLVKWSLENIGHALEIGLRSNDYVLRFGALLLINRWKEAVGDKDREFAGRPEKANPPVEDDEASDTEDIKKIKPKASKHDFTYELIKEKLQVSGKCELTPGEIKHMRDFEIKDEDERKLLTGLTKNASEDNEVAYLLGKKESMRRNRNTNVSDASLYRWVLENKNHAFAKGLTNRYLLREKETDSEINRRIKDAKPTAYAKLRIWESEIHNAQSEKIEDFVLKMQLHFYSKLPEYKDSQVMYVLGQNLSMVTNKNAHYCANQILDNPDDFFVLGLRKNANVLKYASDETLGELKEKDTNDEFKSLIEIELKNRQGVVTNENVFLAALNQVEITSRAVARNGSTTGFANIEVIVENKAVSEEIFAAQEPLSSVVIKRATSKKDQDTVQARTEKPRLTTSRAVVRYGSTGQEKGNPIISDPDGKNAKIVIAFLTSGTVFPPGFDKKDIPDFGFREQDMVSLIDAAIKGKKGLYFIESFWLGLNNSVREYVNRYISAYQKWLEANRSTHSFAKGYYRP